MFTIKSPVEFEEQITKSRFIGNLSYASSIEEAKEFITGISANHKTASHNCWAYIVGLKGETSHSSDAGEPSGTAGKPILGALQKHHLSDVAIVVTRYFGGTKLGIRGLIEAYSRITEETVKIASLQEMQLKDFFKITTQYNFIEKLKYKLNEQEYQLLSIDYQQNIVLNVSINSNLEGENYLRDLQSAGHIEYRFLRTALDLD